MTSIDAETISKLIRSVLGVNTVEFNRVIP